MIPYRVDNPPRSFPIMTVLLIAVNAAVFIYQIALPSVEQGVFIYTHALVPGVLLGKTNLLAAIATTEPDLYRAIGSQHLPVTPLHPVWLTIFTSMFMHAGLAHIGGNMLYLWIFGENVEDALGHARYLLFYLFCGLVAAASQVAASGADTEPMLGASGAIAGVLGAYLVLFPATRVRCLVFLVFYVSRVTLPAGVMLILWFLGQILGSLQPHSGVASFAHIGGFVVGLVLVRSSKRRQTGGGQAEALADA